MMKIKIKSIVMIIPGLLLLGMSSCKKFLDEAPDNRAEINTVEKVAQLVSTAYPTYDYLTMAEKASDNSEDKGPGVGEVNDLMTNYYTWQDVAGSSTNSAGNYWNGCYEAIAAANQALEAIKEGDFGDDVLPYKGEALVARAYAHHMLAIFFATAYEIGGANDKPGIPYVTEPETKLLQDYDRGTVASTYESIEKDLEEGLPLLSAAAYDVPKFHFTPAAAEAFAARFYLFKGEWQKVIDHASKVVPGGDWVSNLRPINSTFRNMTSAEFRTAFTKSDVKATLLLDNCYSTYHYISSPRYGYGAGLSKMFSDVNVTGKGLANKVLYYDQENYTTYKYSGYFFYTGPGIGYPYLTIPLLTVDETLMNRAEAYAELGKFDLALKDINTFYSVRIMNYNPTTDAVTLPKIMAYFSIADPKEGIIATIMAAKKAEFLEEGIRWIDLVRRHMTVKKNLISPEGVESTIELGPDDPRRMFQLPVEATLAGVELNPRP
jgi:hypothetical protein